MRWTGQTYEFSEFPGGSSITAAGSPGQLQFNQGGRLGSSSNLSFDNNLLTIGGGLTVGSAGTITAGTFQGSLAGNANTATRLSGGSVNQIPVQSTSGSTNFISPSQGYFRWTGTTYEFTPGISAGTGTFTGALSAGTGTFTGALSAGTGTFTGLTVGSAGTITAGTFQGSLAGNANTATRLSGGSVNQIPVQSTSGSTNFISPSQGYFRWTGTTYEFTPGISAGTGTFTGLLTAGAGLSANTGNFSGLLTAGAGLSANTGGFSTGLTAGTGNFSGLLTADAGINAGTNTITAGTFKGSLAGNATSANTVFITSIP